MKKVKEIFKKYLIPHEGNDHQPHLLRSRTVGFVCLVVIGVQLATLFYSSYVVPRSRLIGAIFASALVEETNENRNTNNIATLALDPVLTKAAQEKADDMVKNNYFAHVSPAGITPWQWFVSAGYRFVSAGENLAVNFSDSSDVTNAWMNSPEHRANILNSNFTEIGIATAEGTYDGRPAIYVVELFGTPAVTIVSNQATRATTKATPVPIIAKGAASSTKTIASSSFGVSALAAVQGVATTVAEPITTSAIAIAPLIAPPQQKTAISPIVEAAATPRRTLNYIYLLIMAVFFAALLFNVFIKIRIQYPNLILGGVMVIAVVAISIMFGQYATLSHAAIL